MILETFLLMETKTPIRGKSFHGEKSFQDHFRCREAARATAGHCDRWGRRGARPSEATPSLSEPARLLEEDLADGDGDGLGGESGRGGAGDDRAVGDLELGAVAGAVDGA